MKKNLHELSPDEDVQVRVFLKLVDAKKLMEWAQKKGFYSRIFHKDIK